MSESEAGVRGTEHRITYHRELENLNAEILRLGALVAETVPRGTTVLLKGDLVEAQSLVDDDDELDHLSLEIEERVYLGSFELYRKHVSGICCTLPRTLHVALCS